MLFPGLPLEFDVRQEMNSLQETRNKLLYLVDAICVEESYVRQKKRGDTTIFQRGTESSEESSGDDTCSSNLSLNQEPSVELVLNGGVKSSREFSDDNDNSDSSFNQPSLISHAVVKSSGDGNESLNSSSFSNKESPVAISDLDSECEISHEGHDIQHDCSNADMQSAVRSDESSSVTSGDASCDQKTMWRRTVIRPMSWIKMHPCLCMKVAIRL